MLKPEAFQQCFEKWIQSCLTPTSDNDAGTSYIAIDGKTSRRSHDRASGLGALHLVSAWAADQGVSLGQVATEEKLLSIMVMDIKLFMPIFIEYT